MNFSQFSRPQWLFFDLDDTLWDFHRNSHESLRHIYETFREINDKFDSFDSFYKLYHHHNSILWEDFAARRVESNLLKSERWRRTLFPSSTTQSTPEICQIIDNEYLLFLAMQPHTVIGAGKMLQSLTESYMIAVLSNGFIDTQYRKLKYSGLWKYITRTVVSDEAGFQKPDSRLYDYALEATGASGTPIMIGDNAYTDIIGALRAGWKTIWYNPTEGAFPWQTDELIKEGIEPSHFLGSAKDTIEIEHLIRQQAY